MKTVFKGFKITNLVIKMVQQILHYSTALYEKSSIYERVQKVRSEYSFRVKIYIYKCFFSSCVIKLYLNYLFFKFFIKELGACQGRCISKNITQSNSPTSKILSLKFAEIQRFSLEILNSH